MKVKIEVAETPAALARGLMGRKDLPESHGMLFKFPMSVEASFWGKDTYIPLDIAFLDDQNKITSIKHIVPMSTQAVRSDGICDKAIEVNAGFFRRHNIAVGTSVNFILDESGQEIELDFNAQNN